MIIHTVNFSLARARFAPRFVMVVAGILLVTSLIHVRAAELVAWGSDWRYRLGVSEASSPRSAWREVGFSDQAWDAGPSPVGYGEPDIITALPSSSQANWLSVYFRRGFNISNPAGVSQLDLTLRIDDGFVIWINGNEVGRYNVPGGELAYDAAGLNAIEPTTLSLTLTNGLRQLLAPGANVLAVHVFNANRTSSDLVFAARLAATSDTIAPVVVELIPPPGATVRQLEQVHLFFDENVVGVDAGDLLVNGVAASRVTSVSPREYVFSFPEPPSGPVQFGWSPGHGIGDLASPPNLFAGGTWTCTLDPTAPPPSIMISEFLADNSDGIRDDDGNRSDWIELLNPGAEAVDLDGWYLTDDATQLTKWRFPPFNLAPNALLLIWASEQDRANPAEALHTNFRLSASGEYLALVDPQTNVVSEFSPSYPPQHADISYGRDRLDPRLAGFFTIPTPGKPNSASGAGFAPDPVFSPRSGTFTNNTLTVTISASAGEIHYTVDGSVPTAASPAYREPLVLNASTVVQARVFQSNLLPSELGIGVYTLLNSGFGEFSSNLPIMVIQTGGGNISQDQRVRAFVSTFEPRQGRARINDSPDFVSAASVEVRGQTSSGFPKQPYNLELQDPAGNDLEAPLLGLPAESDWVLHNPYSDKCLMNNFLAFELHEKMGHYAPRCRFVEVFVKTSRTRLSYPNDYRGVYVLMEKIKVDGNRVDLARLAPGHDKEPEITGGYIIKKDKDSPGDLNFWTGGGGQFSGQALKYHEPKPREISPAQQAWIAQYLNQFERSLYANDWLLRSGTNHYSHYIDLDSFVDYHWIVEFTKQIDGYRLSNFMSKDRGAKLKMAPIWDWNLAWGNADYLEGSMTNGWYYPLIGDAEHIWLRRLISGTRNGYDKRGDPDFNQRIIDRWSVLRTNILSAANVTARVDEIAANLDEAQARDFARYPRLNQYVWPNPSFYIAPTYSAIIEAMKRWIHGRYAWIDGQFVKSPELSQPPGPVVPGLSLALSAPTGAILFTLDGTDPRLPGGAVNPAARAYSNQALTVNDNIRVFARARSGTNWSGPAVGTYVVKTPPLMMTELMYQPAASQLPEIDSESLEYVELRNVGASELNLQGFRFTEGIEFQFASTSAVTRLAPGAYVLLVKSKGAFQLRYPDAAGFVAGEYTGSLDNQGERMVLEGPLGEPILDFRYSETWFPITAGAGFSLVITDDEAPPDSWDDPASWMRSGREGGSPGAVDLAPFPIQPVLVNEVLSHPEPPAVDAIELYSPTSEAADISGWFLTDEFDTPRKFRVPDGTVIPPGGYATFDRTAFGTADGFALSASGDEVYLFAGTGDELTGYAHGFAFEAADPGVSFGRHEISTGEDRFTAQTQPTLGSANAGPRMGPVVINEIMFRPPDIGTNNNTLEEFVELLNITGSPVGLFDAATPANTWRLRGGADFDFPAAATIPAGGFALLVSFDPNDSAALADFRSAYAVPDGTPVFGAYRGKLNNRGERLALSKPAPVEQGDSGAVLSHVLIDEVQYASAAPWPDGANGTGQSLQRIAPDDFGDDPINWLAGSPTPGAANSILEGDSDGDGLPDRWEMVHFGSLTAVPEEDPDNDAMTNVEEYVAGTTPTDPGSSLRAAMTQSDDGTLRLAFMAVAGRAYALYSADQVDGPWRKAGELPVTGAGQIELTLEPSDEHRFYRVVISWP